jgi:hypothetical protein
MCLSTIVRAICPPVYMYEYMHVYTYTIYLSKQSNTKLIKSPTHTHTHSSVYSDVGPRKSVRPEATTRRATTLRGQAPTSPTTSRTSKAANVLQAATSPTARRTSKAATVLHPTNPTARRTSKTTNVLHSTNPAARRTSKAANVLQVPPQADDGKAHYDQLFHQVNFNLPDDLSDYMRRLNGECAAYRIVKDHDLMRYEFLEVIVRLALSTFSVPEDTRRASNLSGIVHVRMTFLFFT